MVSSAASGGKIGVVMHESTNLAPENFIRSTFDDVVRMAIHAPEQTVRRLAFRVVIS
jgi:hypothetical protein